MNELCGVMIANGMPYDLYWYGDMDAIYPYIEKIKYDRKREIDVLDTSAWLIGRYVQVAIASVFDTKHQIKYPAQPTSHEAKTQEEKTIETYQRLKAWSNTFKVKGQG